MRPAKHFGEIDEPLRFEGLFGWYAVAEKRHYLLRARQEGAPGQPPLGGGRFDAPDGERLIRTVIAYYWGMVTFIDDAVGRLMDVLTRRGLWDTTLVLFTTDHGEMLGDYGRLGKGNFAEPVVRPPSILVPPGGRPAPSSRGLPRRAADVAAHRAGRRAPGDPDRLRRFRRQAAGLQLQLQRELHRRRDRSRLRDGQGVRRGVHHRVVDPQDRAAPGSGAPRPQRLRHTPRRGCARARDRR